MPANVIGAKKNLVKPDGSVIDLQKGPQLFKATIFSEKNISADGVEAVYERHDPIEVTAPYNLDALCKELSEKAAVKGVKRGLVLEIVPVSNPTIILQKIYDGDFDKFMSDMSQKIASRIEVMQGIQRMILHMGQFSSLSHAIVTVGFKESLEAETVSAGFGFINIHLQPTEADNKSFGEVAVNHTKAWIDSIVKPKDKGGIVLP